MGGKAGYRLTWMLSVSFARRLMTSPCCAGRTCSSFLRTTTDSATTSSGRREIRCGPQGGQTATRGGTRTPAMPPDLWLSSTHPPHSSSGPQRRSNTETLTEVDRQMNTHCARTDRRIPSAHHRWTHRQTLTVTVGQQLYQAVEAGVTDSAYVGCTASDGLDRGCYKVLVHAADVGLWDTTTE